MNDEMLVLQSIYCGKNEFELIQSDSNTKQFKLTIPYNTKNKDVEKTDNILQVLFTIYNKNSGKFPGFIILKPNITNQNLKLLLEAVNKNTDQGSLYELIEWLQNNVSSYLTISNKNRQYEEDKNVTCIMHLDHMRSKSRYEKILKTWTLDLGIKTDVLHYKKLILIILQGPNSAVKSFIINLKSQNVDLDSNGKPCKEKMSTNLFFGGYASNVECAFHSFVFEEVKVLKKHFENLKILSIYDSEIIPLLSVKI